jgi:hypothetical protein
MAGELIMSQQVCEILPKRGTHTSDGICINHPLRDSPHV